MFRALCAFLVSLGCLSYLALPADSSDFDELKTIAPSVTGKKLALADFQVFEWVLGPQRQHVRKAVVARSLIAFGLTYFAEEAKTGRWLVGRLPKSSERIVECDSSFLSLKELLAASRFADLPRPPAGYRLREVVRLVTPPTRLASDGSGKVLFVLCSNGDVWRVEPPTGKLDQILRGEDYTNRHCVDRLCTGMTLDRDGRLWIVANERDDRQKIMTNRVTIYRTTKTDKGNPASPKPWLETSYPYGIGPFNHGVGHLAFGPDGYLYVTSGSRTDGNEPGNDPRYAKVGEVPLTACIWRLDPKAAKPEIEVFARGLRNAYGFCWNDKGQMLATDNGPDADPPEELNLIEKGKHYGFPYVFSDWKNKPYKYTPHVPDGLTFTPPIINLGPAAGGTEKAPLATFDAHSSPTGIVYLGNDFPNSDRGGYFVARFGNILKRPQVGFDLLHVRLSKNTKGMLEAHTRRVLFPIARPVDLHLAGKGRVYICEYSRQIENKGYAGMLPGRVLELAYDPK